MPKKKLYILSIGHRKIIGTKAKCESIQRALIGTEQVEHKQALDYTHKGHSYDDPYYLVESEPIATELKAVSEPVLSQEEFSILSKQTERDWELANKKEVLALPEPRKELPAPRLELPYTDILNHAK